MLEISELLGKARKAGAAYGAQHSKISESEKNLVAEVEQQAELFLKEHRGEIDASSGCLVLFNFGTFILGFILFGTGIALAWQAAAPNASSAVKGWAGSIWWIWALVSLAWIIGVIVWNSADKQAAVETKQRTEVAKQEFTSAAMSELQARREKARGKNHDPDEDSRDEKYMPAPQPFGVSHQGAENLCAEWMKYLGDPDVQVTQFVADGGIDLESARFIAQVKNYTGSVGVSAIRELAGVAAVDGRKAIFFTSGTYASGASDFADKSAMALFVYSAEEGSLTASNALAELYLESGF